MCSSDLQEIYDAHTGELLGSRALLPVANNSFMPGLTNECSGARPELRRTMGSSLLWNGCVPAHVCIVCATPGTPTSAPPCTQDDFARLAALADAGS